MLWYEVPSFTVTNMALDDLSVRELELIILDEKAPRHRRQSAVQALLFKTDALCAVPQHLFDGSHIFAD
jgi:hypothetical protein